MSTHGDLRRVAPKILSDRHEVVSSCCHVYPSRAPLKFREESLKPHQRCEHVRSKVIWNIIHTLFMLRCNRQLARNNQFFKMPEEVWEAWDRDSTTQANDCDCVVLRVDFFTKRDWARERVVQPRIPSMIGLLYASPLLSFRKRCCEGCLSVRGFVPEKMMMMMMMIY